MTTITRKHGPRVPRDDPGYVYVLKAEHGGVKIGASVNPSAREKHEWFSCPVEQAIAAVQSLQGRL